MQQVLEMTVSPVYTGRAEGRLLLKLLQPNAVFCAGLKAYAQ